MAIGIAASRWAPAALSLLRLITGLLFLQHGLTKYVGFPAPTPPTFHMMSLLGVAGAIEIVAGALVAVGLFTRLAAFVASGEMAFAYFMSHFPRGFFPQANGGDLAVLLCFVFLYLAAAGPGPWSLDGGRR